MTGEGSRNLIRGDLYRYQGARGARGLLRTYLREPGFRFSFWLRLASLAGTSLGARWLRLFAKWRRHHHEIRLGISIPAGTKIGAGLFIGHFGGIVVHPGAEIGRNCNLSHGVTIGQTNRGSHAGTPVIGDSVFIGPGAAIIGRVRVGSDVAIGANAVVIEDVEDHSVVVGIPAHAVSGQGSRGYVDWTEYDRNS